MALLGSAASLAAAPPDGGAQQARVYRIGVVFHGGSYAPALDGLRDGLGELGLVEGKQFVFHVRDVKGDLKSVEAAARSLEGEQVDLIYAVSASVTLATKRATKSVPIVFYAGADPVGLGLIESIPRPGGRLTGIHGWFSELAAKRLEVLKEMLPGLRRVVTFHNPGNAAAQQSLKTVRDAARRLGVELVERHVTSVENLREALRSLRPGEVDAFCYVADSMITSQADLVVDIARTKRLPTMFGTREDVAKGALASYGVSYHAMGRRSAKHVQRVLLGADPGTIPVEQLDRFFFAINLKTAKAFGLTIPPSVLARADEVID